MKLPATILTLITENTVKHISSLLHLRKKVVIIHGVGHDAQLTTHPGGRLCGPPVL